MHFLGDHMIRNIKYFHFIYLAAFASSITADDLASKKRSPMSLISSTVMLFRPDILAATADGASNWTANLKKKTFISGELLKN